MESSQLGRCYPPTTEWQSSLSRRSFLSAYFYRYPVELEPVHNGEFLGTILHSGSRTLVFQQPTESFQFRPMNSAGALAHKMSAALARICLASRNCFPKSQAEQDVQILIDAYKTYGYDPIELVGKPTGSFERTADSAKKRGA